MSGYTMKLYQNDISSPDYSTIFSGDFDNMPKRYLAELNIPFYIPLEDDFKLTFDKKLLSSAERYNLLNPNVNLRKRNADLTVEESIFHAYSTGTTGTGYFKSVSLKVGLLSAGIYKIKNNFELIQDTTIESGLLTVIKTDSTGESELGFYGQSVNNGEIFTFTVSSPEYIFIRLLLSGGNIGILDTTLVDWYDLQLVKVASVDTPFPEYQVYYGYEYGDMWDNVDYCTFEEQTDFTPTRKRFYFVEEMKTQVASGVREFKFKIDKWFTRQYNSYGVQLLQTGGHLGALQNTYTNFDYIVKPILSGWSETNLSGMPKHSQEYTTQALIVIYQTPSGFLTLLSRHEGISDVIARYDIMMNATQFKYSDTSTPFNITPLACYIIPSYFCHTADFMSGGYIYSGGAWTNGSNVSTIKYLNTHNTRTFTITTTIYSDSKNAPTKRAYLLGTIGTQFLSYGTIPSDDSTAVNHTIKFVVSFNLDKVVIYMACNETGGMFVDISKDFEETVVYSTFDQWLQQNRASVSAEIASQAVSATVGIAGAFMGGNVSALTGAIEGIAKTSASLYDKKRQTSTMKGSGSGFDNMIFTGGKCFFVYRYAFVNEKEVNETIKSLGYKYTGLLTDTTLIPSNKYLNYYDGLYSRYIEGEVIPSLLEPSTPSSLKRWIEPDIKDAFRKGVYVYYKA